MIEKYKLRNGNETTNLVVYILDCHGKKGASVALAITLGVTKQTVSGYVNRGIIPPAYAFDVQKFTGGIVKAKQVCDEAKRLATKKSTIKSSSG